MEVAILTANEIRNIVSIAVHSAITEYIHARKPQAPAYLIGDETPIEEIGLPSRVENCVLNANLKTVGDVRKTKDCEFLKCRNFGRGSLRILRMFTDNGTAPK